MTIQEMREKRTKLLTDAQAIMLAATVTAENRASVDAMLADVDALELDITRTERVSVVDTENRSTRNTPRAVPGARSDDTVEARNARQKVAFDKVIRGGIQGLNAETRERFAGVEQRDIIEASTGGTLIPQAFFPELLESEKAWGDLLTIVSQKLPIKIIVMNNGYLGMVRQWQTLFYPMTHRQSCMRKSKAHPMPTPQKTQCSPALSSRPHFCPALRSWSAGLNCKTARSTLPSL